MLLKCETSFPHIVVFQIITDVLESPACGLLEYDGESASEFALHFNKSIEKSTKGRKKS
jgi:hypothetical protein